MSDERRLAKLIDIAVLPPNTDESALHPTAIVELVFFHPPPELQHLEKVVTYDRPVPLDKPLDMNIAPDNVGLINKLTPEMLIAIVAHILSSSPNARVACARLRNEVLGWRFERADGTVE